MRLALLLVAVCALTATCTMAATPATFGVGVNVVANTFTQFGFTAGLPPLVGITSSTATTLTVTPVTSISASFDGFSLNSGIGAGASLVQGLQIAVSTSASSVSQVAITLPAITASQQSSISAGLLGILYVAADASTSAVIPPSQIQVNSDNTLSFNYTSPGTFYIVNIQTAPIVKSINNGVASFFVAANATMSFAISTGASGAATAIEIANFTANAAGSVTISASAQASAEASASFTSGRAVLSNVYNITYNGAASTKKGVLIFYKSATNVALNLVDTTTIQWYRLEHGASSWAPQASVQTDASVSVTVVGFSDWSVQATNSSSSSSSSGSGFSSTGGNPGAASALAPVALLVAALCGLLMA